MRRAACSSWRRVGWRCERVGPYARPVDHLPQRGVVSEVALLLSVLL